jgi:hypothetical protein
MEKINYNKIKRIVIIGGSASGFSSAWLLINGPGLHENYSSSSKYPNAKLKSIINC